VLIKERNEEMTLGNEERKERKKKNIRKVCCFMEKLWE
jgi:hypothetical protein